MILFDTDILTLLFAGHPQVNRKTQEAEEKIYIPIVVKIEVLQGRFDALLKAADEVQLLRAMTRLEDVTRQFQALDIVPIDQTAAQHFERFRQDKKLKKIGRADLLIGCTALAHRAKLVTRNLRHFQLIPGLRLENWAD